MAIDATRTSWGYAVTCTGGTAAATVIVPAGTPLQLQAIVVTGAATTDIVTVTDAAGNLIFRANAPSTSGSTSITFPGYIRPEGLKVGIAGATTGWCSIFLGT